MSVFADIHVLRLDGMTYEQAMERISSVLTNDCMLVGFNLSSDINWLQLRRGIHYSGVFELTRMFRAQGKAHPIVFPLKHLARYLLNLDGI